MTSGLLIEGIWDTTTFGHTAESLVDRNYRSFVCRTLREWNRRARDHDV